MDVRKRVARLVTVEGAEVNLLPRRKSPGFTKRELHALLGPALGVFVLDAVTVMVVNLAAELEGLLLNAKAMRLLRRSRIDPLALIHGPVLLAGRTEIRFRQLTGRDFPT